MRNPSFQVSLILHYAVLSSTLPQFQSPTSKFKLLLYFPDPNMKPTESQPTLRRPGIHPAVSLCCMQLPSLHVHHVLQIPAITGSASRRILLRLDERTRAYGAFRSRSPPQRFCAYRLSACRCAASTPYISGQSITSHGLDFALGQCASVLLAW